jgi:hypothetical protein
MAQVRSQSASPRIRSLPPRDRLRSGQRGQYTDFSSFINVDGKAFKTQWAMMRKARAMAGGGATMPSSGLGTPRRTPATATPSSKAPSSSVRRDESGRVLTSRVRELEAERGRLLAETTRLAEVEAELASLSGTTPVELADDTQSSSAVDVGGVSAPTAGSPHILDSVRVGALVYASSRSPAAVNEGQTASVVGGVSAPTAGSPHILDSVRVGARLYASSRPPANESASGGRCSRGSAPGNAQTFSWCPRHLRRICDT